MLRSGGGWSESGNWRDTRHETRVTRIHHLVSPVSCLVSVFRTSHRGIRGLIRDALVYVGVVLLAPLWLPARLERRWRLGEECFTFAAQLLCLVPGKPAPSECPQT